MTFTKADELWDWLSEHHSKSGSVWAVTYLKGAPKGYISRDEMLDALVAFGWTDGRRKKLDRTRTMQLISPRKTEAWAKSYKDRAARLEKDGLMQAPGRAAIRASKEAGLWDYWADVDALLAPHDLVAALDRANAADLFAALAPSYRRNLLRWIKLGKTDATRQKRIAAIVQATEDGKKIPNM